MILSCFFQHLNVLDISWLGTHNSKLCLCLHMSSHVLWTCLCPNFPLLRRVKVIPVRAHPYPEWPCLTSTSAKTLFSSKVTVWDSGWTWSFSKHPSCQYSGYRTYCQNCITMNLPTLHRMVCARFYPFRSHHHLFLLYAESTLRSGNDWEWLISVTQDAFLWGLSPNSRKMNALRRKVGLEKYY